MPLEAQGKRVARQGGVDEKKSRSKLRAEKAASSRRTPKAKECRFRKRSLKEM
jgi:hypothetical protein